VGGRGECPRDSVLIGWTRIDKDEASVWQIPSLSKPLLKKVQFGRATLSALTRGGVMQVGCRPWNAARRRISYS
jgi:hypothetical protein